MKFNDLFADEFEVRLVRQTQEVVYRNNWRHRSVIVECREFRFTFFRLYSAGYFPASHEPSLSEQEQEHFNKLPKDVQKILTIQAKKYLQSCPFHKNR